MFHSIARLCKTQQAITIFAHFSGEKRRQLSEFKRQLYKIFILLYKQYYNSSKIIALTNNLLLDVVGNEGNKALVNKNKQNIHNILFLKIYNNINILPNF